MTLASHTFTGPAGGTQFALPFGAIRAADLLVLVNSVSSTFTLTGTADAPVITLPSALASNSDTVEVSRVTQITDRLVDFTTTTLTESDLDTAARQALFISQELSDRIDSVEDRLETTTVPTVPSPPGVAAYMYTAGSTWTYQTPAQLRSTLGVSAVTTVPDPSTISNQFLKSNGTSFIGVSAATLASTLSLGPWATDAGTPNAAVRTAIGVTPPIANGIVILDGSGNLPAGSGANLTGVLKDVQWARATHQTAYNVNGGDYLSANTWQTRPLTNISTGAVVGSAPSWTISSNRVTGLAIGKYRVTVKASSYINGAVKYRLWLNNTTDVGQSVHTVGGNLDHNVSLVSYVDVASNGSTIELQMIATATNAVGSAYGTQHATAALGNNYFTDILIEKLA